MDSKSSIEMRTYVVLTLLALLPLAIAAKMLVIATIDGKELRASYEAQPLVNVPLEAYRGNLLDRNGKLFRVNTIEYLVAADPSIPGFNKRAPELYKALGIIKGRSAASFKRMVQKRSSPKYVRLASTRSESSIEKLRQLKIPGVILSEKLDRVNIQQGVGNRVLGITNRDRKGISGIELEYDEYLSGVEGKQVLFRDSRGYVSPVPGSPVVQPIHGEHLQLTLDLPRQAVMENLLSEAVKETDSKWGTAIAMNVHNGEIIAVANHDSETRKTGKPRSLERANRAISAVLEPGSTFKIVVYSAAIEAGLIKMDDSWKFTGIRERVGDRFVTDSHFYPDLTVREAIVKSSNIAAARTGLLVGEESLYKMARALGFGQASLIDLPGEAPGKLRPIENWSKTSLETLSFGYEVGVTPIQMLVAYSALANGGRIVRPHVVKHRLSPEGEILWTAPQDSIRRAFSKRTSEILTPAFVEVVEDGTAKQAKVEGLKIAGKTGTTEKLVNGRYDSSIHRASFVGFFPADDPQIAIYIAMDEPRGGASFGGSVAGPIFKKIAERWVSLSPELRSLDYSRKAQSPLEFQNEIAKVRIRSQGLPAIVANNIRQAHGIDTLLVEPRASEVTQRMLDVKGMSTRQAVALLASKGVKSKLVGTGIVMHQEPSPGEIIRGPAILSGSD